MGERKAKISLNWSFALPKVYLDPVFFWRGSEEGQKLQSQVQA